MQSSQNFTEYSTQYSQPLIDAFRERANRTPSRLVQRLISRGLTTPHITPIKRQGKYSTTGKQTKQIHINGGDESIASLLDNTASSIYNGTSQSNISSFGGNMSSFNNSFTSSQNIRFKRGSRQPKQGIFL